jgi:hypothetical protein
MATSKISLERFPELSMTGLSIAEGNTDKFAFAEPDQPHGYSVRGNMCYINLAISTLKATDAGGKWFVVGLPVPAGNTPIVSNSNQYMYIDSSGALRASTSSPAYESGRTMRLNGIYMMQET